MIRRTTLLAGFVLFAFLASPLVGVADAAPVCRTLKTGGTVCVDTFPTCPAAWYVPPFTDFGAGARHCVTGNAGEDAVQACDEVVAGFWTLGGFTGVDEQACVAYVEEPDGSTCVYAWGRQWVLVPVCFA